MSIFLAFKALSDAAACIISFRQLKIISYNYPFGNKAIRLLSAVDLYNQWGKLFLVRPL
jgi:hypothetical protein